MHTEAVFEAANVYKKDNMSNNLKPFEDSNIKFNQNRKMVKEIFLKNPVFFTNYISFFYPLSKEILDKYNDKLSLWILSEKEIGNHFWSEEFSKTFKDSWKWSYLSQNKSLPWSENLIEKYKDKWNWKYLSENKSLPWSEELIEKYKDKWHLRWGSLSKNEALPWSEELIEKYSNKWNWNKWGWSNLEDHDVYCGSLSTNKTLPWSESFIEKYKDNWDWGYFGLSRNSSLPWTESFIEKYKDKWCWNTLSLSPFLPWSEKLIEQFKDKWDWYNLCENTSIPWSEKLIEKYKERLGTSDLKYLGLHFPFLNRDEFIENHKEEWDWENTFIYNNIQWNLKLIAKAANYYNFSELYDDIYITLETFLNEGFWNTLKPYVDDVLIEEVFKEIDKNEK